MQHRHWTQESVTARIDPFKASIFKAFQEGWHEWRRLTDSTEDETYSARTRANVVYDFILRALRRRLSGTGISIFKKRYIYVIDFGDGLQVRIKKLDRSGRPRCLKTRNAEMMMNGQTSFLAHDGYSRHPNELIIVAGYMLDHFQRDIDSVRIVCMKGFERVLWYDEVRSPILTQNAVKPLAVDGRETKVRAKKRAANDGQQANESTG